MLLLRKRGGRRRCVSLSANQRAGCVLAGCQAHDDLAITFTTLNLPVLCYSCPNLML